MSRFCSIVRETKPVFSTFNKEQLHRMNLVTLRTFDRDTEAHLIKGQMEAAGIPCFLTDEFTHAANPFYNQAIGGIKLQVAEPDLEEAIHVLHEIDPTYVAWEKSKVDTCPNCSTKDIEADLPENNNAFSAVWFTIKYLFQPSKRGTFVCNNCNTRFRDRTYTR